MFLHHVRAGGGHASTFNRFNCSISALELACNVTVEIAYCDCVIAQLHNKAGLGQSSVIKFRFHVHLV